MLRRHGRPPQPEGVLSLSYNRRSPEGGRAMDTTLTIERTIFALDERFTSKIDLSDLKASASETERRNCQLSRGLTALAVMALTEADTQEAVQCITDGY